MISSERSLVLVARKHQRDDISKPGQISYKPGQISFMTRYFSQALPQYKNITVCPSVPFAVATEALRAHSRRHL